jgi:type I restriction enzyme M protein
MEPPQLNWIANFLWGIGDDVLRDLYVRGKYRDVILPMTVLRRLDVVLEPTKQAVLDRKASLDKAGIVHQDQALRQAAGQAFYNTSKFTLRDLKNRASQQRLKADFEAYLDGFSPNVQDILDNFEFRNQIPRAIRKGVPRWLPVIGAVGVGTYAYFDTGQVARTAIELFEREITLDCSSPHRF